MEEGQSEKWMQRLRSLRNTQRQKEMKFKTVLLGYQGVGKTALIVRCLADRFYNNYVSEPGETYQYSVTFGQKKVTYDIIETEGKNDALISYADAVLLIFSIIDYQSFQYAKEMFSKVKELLSFRRNALIMMIANKCDIKKQVKVQKEEYETFCGDRGLKYFELSAAVPLIKFDVVFEEIYKQLYLNKKNRRPKSCVLTPSKIEPITECGMSKSLGEEQFMKIVHPRPRSCGSLTALRLSAVFDSPETVL